MTFIRNFMLTIGPISSVLDFLTFYLFLNLFGAQESLFRTGWFMESIATQVLVIFVIRTRPNPLPPGFFGLLSASPAQYVGAVEGAKHWFYKRQTMA